MLAGYKDPMQMEKTKKREKKRGGAESSPYLMSWCFISTRSSVTKVRIRGYQLEPFWAKQAWNRTWPNTLIGHAALHRCARCCCSFPPSTWERCGTCTEMVDGASSLLCWQCWNSKKTRLDWSWLICGGWYGLGNCVCHGQQSMLGEANRGMGTTHSAWATGD